ncbi:MAG: hypothetical protein WD042_04365 [Phycisphaeraceae bacterium]
MLKFATILDNPGEPQPETRYRNPEELVRLGYNGLVIYETTGLSGVDSPESVGTGEMRRWVERQSQNVGETIHRAAKAGLGVYIVYDTLSLPRTVVERHMSDMVCKNRPTTLCPASEKAVEYSVRAVESLMGQWPELAGVVLRFGDNDAARLPYLVGNDIYQPHCARCSLLGRADRIVLILEQFHKLVVGKLNKRLIARAWNVRPNGMHDSVELAQRIAPKLPGEPRDDRFILSFKFSETDFWRYQRWNPSSLVFGDRPIMYELQCQREFEGKGGIPNWQVPLWQHGYPETLDAEPRQGLAMVADQVNLAGLWAWVRGGGWGGPFTKNEAWIDANVVAVPLLADDPKIDAATLADKWIRQRLRVTDDRAAEALGKILADSAQFVLKGFYIGPFARQRQVPWHPNGDWIQDDLIDVQAAWRMIQRLPDSELDQVVQEKKEAVEQVAADSALLQQVMTDSTRNALEPLVNTLHYAESLFETLRDLLAGLAAFRRYQRTRDASHAATARQRLLAAQSYWNHHSQRHGSLPGCATAFREANFWDVTQRILNEVGELQKT